MNQQQQGQRSDKLHKSRSTSNTRMPMIAGLLKSLNVLTPGVRRRYPEPQYDNPRCSNRHSLQVFCNVKNRPPLIIIHKIPASGNSAEADDFRSCATHNKTTTNSDSMVLQNVQSLGSVPKPRNLMKNLSNYTTMGIQRHMDVQKLISVANFLPSKPCN